MLLSLYIYIFFFGSHHAACRILVPQPEIEFKPWQRKHWVLTPGSLGNSLVPFFILRLCWPYTTDKNLFSPFLFSKRFYEKVVVVVVQLLSHIWLLVGGKIMVISSNAWKNIWRQQFLNYRFSFFNTSNFNWNYWIFMWVLLWHTLTSNFFFVPMSTRLQNALLSFSTSQLLLITWQKPWGEKLLWMSGPILYISLLSSILSSPSLVIVDAFCWLQTYF